MAEQAQGALSLAANQTPEGAQAPQELNYDFAEAQKRLSQQRQNVDLRRKDLLNLAETRRQLFDPTLLALAQGLLAPTKTGSFGESLGYAAGNVQQAQAQEAKRQEDIARMRYELETSALQQEKEESEYNRQNVIRNLSGKLVNFTVDEKTGSMNYTIDPLVAKKLTSLTGDLKYADTLINNIKTQKKNQMATELFSEKTVPGKDGQPDQRVFEFNPAALFNVVKLSDDPAKDIKGYLDLVPQLRMLGVVKGLENEGTPFDVVASLALTPAVREQAKQASARYLKGLIKPEQAEKLAKDMMDTDMRHQEAQGRRVDRQTAMAQAAAFHSVSQALAQQRMDEIKRQNEEKKVIAQQAQKTLFDKADDTIRSVEEIRAHPGRASGVWQAYRPTQLVPGTDAYDFNQQLDVIKSKAFLANVQEMKGLGALSNKEGDKITDAISKLNPKMSKEAFDKSLDEIVAIMNRAKQRARDIAEGRMPTFDESKPASTAPSGRKPLTSFGG